MTKAKLALIVAGAIAASPATVSTTAAAQAGSPGNIEWSIAREGSRADASKVQLTIESHWGAGSSSVWSNDRPVSDLLTCH